MNNDQSVYRVNPFCPVCGEEHCAYDILLTDAEQAVLDQYYLEQNGKSTFELLLAKPPLFVERKLKCPNCESIFTGHIGIYREDRLGYHSDELVPMHQYPLHP